MAGKIKLGTPIKAWKDVKTGEVKTYDEWIKSKLPEKNNDENKAGIAIDMMIFKDELLPIV